MKIQVVMLHDILVLFEDTVTVWRSHMNVL